MSLRSGEPDLEITVRNGETTKVFHHYSMVMASFYGFFDSLLASGMQEAQTMKVTLEDVEPAVFELATALLQNPIRARSASAEEAIQAAFIYHKYDSKAGFELVERVLCEFMDTLIAKESGSVPSLSDLEIFIEVLVYSKESGHAILVSKGKEFLEKHLLTIEFLQQIKFYKDDLEKVLAFIAENKDCYQDFHETYFDRHEELPDFRHANACSWFMAAVHSICILHALCEFHLVYEIHVHCKWKPAGENDLRHESDYIVVALCGQKKCLRGCTPCALFGGHIEDASAVVAPCALLRPKLGVVGTEYRDSDWAAVLRFPRMPGRDTPLVVEFVYPLSGNQLLPPADLSGWQLLTPPLDEGEISIVLRSRN